jgi:hypothetical protein
LKEEARGSKYEEKKRISSVIFRRYESDINSRIVTITSLLEKHRPPPQTFEVLKTSKVCSAH